jgi:hypothetical protein
LKSITPDRKPGKRRMVLFLLAPKLPTLTLLSSTRPPPLRPHLRRMMHHEKSKKVCKSVRKSAMKMHLAWEQARNDFSHNEVRPPEICSDRRLRLREPGHPHICSRSRPRPRTWRSAKRRAAVRLAILRNCRYFHRCASRLEGAATTFETALCFFTTTRAMIGCASRLMFYRCSRRR